MRVRPYSTRPVRLCLQVISDLAILAWVVIWIEIARIVDAGVHKVAGSGYALQSGAGQVSTHLRDAGHRVSDVPLVGDPLSTPLTSAGGAAGSVADAGRDLGDRITGAALPAGLAVALTPIVPILMIWLALRLRFALRAGAYSRLARIPDGDTLLALRALAARSPARLMAISRDPAGAWRRGDPEIVRRLADLELRLGGVPRPRRLLPDRPTVGMSRLE